MISVVFNEILYSFDNKSCISLLDVSNELTEARIGCGKGVCGSCLIRVIEGSQCISEKTAVEHTTLSILDKDDKDYRLLCQCVITSDVKLCSKSI